MSELPYPGLRPFQRSEADIFFGREDQTDQLLEKLAQTRFIAVVGLSGCGKSSLVRAGMIAALESGYLAAAGADWRVAEMRPGSHPLRNLAEALDAETALGPERSPTSGNESQAAAENLAQTLAAHGPLGLVEILRARPLPKRTNLLLLVDQFEEIFRYHRQGDRNEAEAFVALLLTSVEQREFPIYIVITMRSDFSGDCALFRGLPELLNRSQFLAPRLTREQQRMAIIGPARVFGGDVEPRLVHRLLDEMGTDPDQLPLLQHCLMRLWFRATPHPIPLPEGVRGLSDSLSPLLGGEGWGEGGKLTLTLADYEAIGGLANALSEHADEAFAELDQPGRQTAERLFRCLSERGAGLRDTRRPAPLGEVAAVAGVSPDEAAGVVEVFRRPDRCFLLPPAGTPLTAGTVLDISHESLIRQWRRMNAWVEEETKSAEMYRRLEQTAYLWRQGQAALWINPDLELALNWKEQEQPTAEWARRYGNHFQTVMEFLNASEQSQEKKRFQAERVRREKLKQQKWIRAERERQRDLKLTYARRQLTIVFVGLIIALSLAGWTFWERSNTQRALAETQKAKAETENALTKEEQARKVAEEQRQFALEAEKKAKEANAQFQEMVTAIFGFLSKEEQIRKFWDWIEKNFPQEKFSPALHLLIDSSGVDKAQKEYWRKGLAKMPQNEMGDLLELLGNDALMKAGKVGVEEGLISHPIFYVRPGMALPIRIDIPYDDVKIDPISDIGTVILGQESGQIIYIAPAKPGGDALVRVNIKDKNGQMLEQKVFIIKIRERTR